MPPPPSPVDWQVLPGLSPYLPTVAAMEARADAIRAGTASEAVWLLEHPPLLTAGTGARVADLLEPDRFPVHPTGRGGRHTYHGPGQRVGYVMLDLARRGRDVRGYVQALEGWVIAALAALGLAARRDAAGIGIWVALPDGGTAKIGAIGVRVRRWVTLHGFALNVAPALDHYQALVPCGIPDHPVTSLAALGLAADMASVDRALAAALPAFLAALEVEPIGP